MTTLLLDTSAAVALVLADHEHHGAVMADVGDVELGLSGHAAFEAFSVLTRLPGPNRRPPATVVEGAHAVMSHINNGVLRGQQGASI